MFLLKKYVHLISSKVEIASKILPFCLIELLGFWRAFRGMVGGWVERFLAGAKTRWGGRSFLEHVICYKIYGLFNAKLSFTSNLALNYN